MTIQAPRDEAPAVDPTPPVRYFVPPGRELWVFGYGSLMWKPGFDFVEKAEARLFGYHRRLCIYSFRHRGTPERPGLVLGLDRGGSCHGMAFRVAADKVAEVTEYLWHREMISGVYQPTMVRVRIGGKSVSAGTFVANPAHRQYCAGREPGFMADLILQGVGQSGANPDYLFSTVAHLDTLGLRDHTLHDLAELVRARMVRR